MNLQKSPNQQNNALIIGAGASQIDGLNRPGYCKPCGVKVRIGVFFDAFGRCVLDDRETGQFSNIAKLWFAHKDMTTRPRPLQEIWFKLYYPGIATYYDSAINHELNGRDISLLAIQFAKAVKDAQSKAEKKAKSFSPVEKAKSAKKAAVKEGKKRALSAAKEMWESRHGARTFKEIAGEHWQKSKDDAYKTVVDKGAKAVDKMVKGYTHARIFVRSPLEYIERGGKRVGKRVWRKGVGAIKDIGKNPLRAGKALVYGVAAEMGLEVIPVLRDSKVAAMTMGLGFETRFAQAQDDFKELLQQVKACPDVQRIHDIEVCVFGADRGATMARAFVNEILDTYKEHGKVQFEGAEISIKFMGLFDSVASLVGASSELLSIVPLIKKDFSEQKLAVPDAVQRCVHMIAAHEQRLYQRLDSLAKTKGEEYYYPGASEDVTGGMPQGEDGFRDMLSRVPLQEMMMVAQSAGAVFPTIAELKKTNTFRLFDQTQDFPLPSGKTTNVVEMIRQYRKVAGTAGKDPEERLAAHQGVFLRWLHLRYKDAVFMAPMQQATHDDAESLMKQWNEAKQVELEKKIAYGSMDQEVALIPISERTSDNPENIAAHARLGQAHKEMVAAQHRREELEKQVAVANNRARTLEFLSERVDHEVATLKRKRAWRNSPFAHVLKDPLWTPLRFPALAAASMAAKIAVLPDEITDTQLIMLEAWEKAASGSYPLPEEVVAMFDELVHDTLLVSWYDHLFAHHIYFDGRGVDYLGKTPERKATPTYAPRQTQDVAHAS